MTYAPPPPSPYGAPGTGYPMQPQRTSAAAVTSLICGILGCLGITALIGIITGIIGIKATGNPNVKGRGLAIAGLILSILTGLGLILFGGGIWALIAGTQAGADYAKAFTMDLNANNITAAAAKTDGSVSQADLKDAADDLKAAGGIDTILMPARTVNNSTWQIEGVAVMKDGSQRRLTYTLQRAADESFKLTDFDQFKK